MVAFRGGSCAHPYDARIRGRQAVLRPCSRLRHAGPAARWPILTTATRTHRCPRRRTGPMNRRTAIHASLLALAVALGAPSADAARGDRARSDRAQTRQSQDVAVSRDRAAKIARSATGGRVLSVKLTGNGRPWYRVKVLTKGGRVRTVAVDAGSGAVRN